MFEPTYAEQWASRSQTYRACNLSNVVGFEIAVTRIEAKFKLSQNRPRDDQVRVIDSVTPSGGHASRRYGAADAIGRPGPVKTDQGKE